MADSADTTNLIFKFTGIVEEVMKKETFASGFEKQTLVLVPVPEKQNAKYPKYLPFEFKKEKCALLNSLLKGMKVTVTFSLDGRKWEKDGSVRFFPGFDAFKVDRVDGGAAQSGAAQSSNVPPPAEPPSSIDEVDDDDVPF